MRIVITCKIFNHDGYVNPGVEISALSELAELKFSTPGLKKNTVVEKLLRKSHLFHS